MFRNLWESEEEGMMDSIDVKVRIIEFSDIVDEKDKEFYMEVVSRNKQGFWERLKIGLKYAFKNARVIFTFVSLSKEDIKRLKEVGISYVEE